MRRWFAVLMLVLLVSPVSAQTKKKKTPAPVPAPTEAILQAIAEKTAALEKAIAELPDGDSPLAAFRPDVEIFRNAAQLLTRHKEFFSKDSAASTLDVLDKGLARAKAIKAGDLSWRDVVGKTVVRGYRSEVDGSAQPYAVTVPASFQDGQPSRVDVVLHGRDGTFTEVKFLKNHADRKSADNPFIQIDIAGRGNNAYRWAGERDVLEAVQHFQLDARRRSIPIEPSRIVLRGFSMGGAGTWHLGLHHPDKWCVMSPGAGFTTTHGYIAGLPNPLPPHQEACLKIYDAVHYAENAAMIPIVAYSGGMDAQKKAADNIEARVKELGLSMVHLIAPDEAHRFPPEYVKKAEVYWSKYAELGRPKAPEKVHFTTYTLKYPVCEWVTILAVDTHYEKTQVDAERTRNGFRLSTKNVDALSLDLNKLVDDPSVVIRKPQSIIIDDQKLVALPEKNLVRLINEAGRWKTISADDWQAHVRAHNPKRPGLQGPIDDAFTSAFLCVRGTGQPWHAETQKSADADLARFEQEWSKFLRGRLPIKNDTDVTDDDIAGKNLILFGDPSSNSLIAKVIGELPIRWTAKDLTMAGQTVASDRHLPALIHPNPLNRDRYVVLNSGHTFHAKEFTGTNAQLYPRLGDFAILRISEAGGLNVDVVAAGLFDETWRFPTGKK